ncbi:unnamed protein product [Diatraea saccharalis]|uniref:Farnesol dehydrogenase-like n=1 Tax=Diatraea saccharalis TaxID=40085 RepID=A0A9N9R7Z8_9NEOP|nr:unnamed protein product [Diatraea saccharalis]
MDRWKGKTAVVTGANAGIGAAIAVQLVNAGMRVIGLDVNLLANKKISQAQGQGSLHSLHCDVTKSDELTTAFNWIEEQYGCVHVYVNNAGVNIPGHITDVAGEQISDEQLLRVMNTNSTATIMGTRLAVASMKKNSFDGHLIYINSIAGHYIPTSASFNVYTCSKHAVTAFTRTISPGLVDTAMASGIKDMPSLKADDVANTVLYALSVPPNVNISEITIQPVGEKRL